MTTFVSVTCFDDPDVLVTCENMLATASQPEALRIVVILQTDRPQEYLALNELPIEVHVFPFSWGTGVGKPRAEAYSRIRDETYYFQTDCHMRFQPSWDEKLLSELRACPKQAVLSALPPGFVISTGELLTMQAYAPKPTKFNENCPVSEPEENCPVSEPEPISMELPAPPMIAHVAAGLVFCEVEAIHVAPPDPEYGYHGEEISHSLRLWTNGYSIYAPRHLIAHHAYRDKNPRVGYGDNLARDGLNHWRATQRIEVLLGRKAPYELPHPYGLGKVRSIASWEQQFKIDLAKRVVY